MIITVFEDSRHKSTTFDMRIPEHQKPTFTGVAKKIALLRGQILRIHCNLRNIDKALDELHDCIIELEEVCRRE